MELTIETLTVLGVIATVMTGVATIVAVLLSQWLLRRHENRQAKLDTLKRLLGNRMAVTHDQRSVDADTRVEFNRALQEVPIIFGGAATRRIYRAYWEGVVQRDPDRPTAGLLVALFHEMYREADVAWDGDYMHGFVLEPPSVPGPKR